LFRYPVRVVIEELKDLKSNKIYSEYQNSFNDFMTNLCKENKTNPKGENVRKMIHLIKDSCINQLQIETILDTPIKLSQLIKNKGKKLLNEDLKLDSQTKLLKLVNALIKADFITNGLSNFPLDELIGGVKMLENQKNLVAELK
jgi:hypothetical protein